LLSRLSAEALAKVEHPRVLFLMSPLVALLLTPTPPPFGAGHWLWVDCCCSSAILRILLIKTREKKSYANRDMFL
jgi:hypothetical protein